VQGARGEEEREGDHESSLCVHGWPTGRCCGHRRSTPHERRKIEQQQQQHQQEEEEQEQKQEEEEEQEQKQEQSGWL
jgi:hypothetical protein